MNNDIRNLLERKSPVMISLYMPTHRTSPDNEQDPIRFNNLLIEMKKKIKEKNYPIDPDILISAMKKIVSTTSFIENIKEGLAIFIDDENLIYYQLGVRLKEKLVISDHFHIMPLINYFDIFTDYYALDLSKDRFFLYNFNSEGFFPIDLGEDVKTRFDELFDDKDVKNTNYTKTNPSFKGTHAQKTKAFIAEVETEKYMRYVGNAVNEYIKNNEPYSLLVFGTTANIGLFNKINKNILDIPATVDKPLSSLEEDKAIELFREKLLPRYIKSVEKEIDKFEIALGSDEDMGTDNFSKIERLAKEGRIKKLLINSKAKVETDKLDKIVSDVILSSGEVITIDENLVDFKREFGAIYRY